MSMNELLSQYTDDLVASVRLEDELTESSTIRNTYPLLAALLANPPEQVGEDAHGRLNVYGPMPAPYESGATQAEVNAYTSWRYLFNDLIYYASGRVNGARVSPLYSYSSSWNTDRRWFEIVEQIPDGDGRLSMNTRTIDVDEPLLRMEVSAATGEHLPIVSMARVGLSDGVHLYAEREYVYSFSSCGFCNNVYQAVCSDLPSFVLLRHMSAYEAHACPSCIESGLPELSYCNECEAPLSWGETMRTWWWRLAGREVCRSCHIDAVGTHEVQSYNFRPAPKFGHDDGTQSITPMHNAYFGIELETEWDTDVSYDDYCDGYDCDEDCPYFHEGPPADTTEALGRIMANGNGKKLYAKSDGSLDNGFEIVSHPLSLQHWQKSFDWSWMERVIPMGLRAWDHSNCGLHIHISKTAWENKAHFARWWILMYNNAASWIKLAGRHSEEYANWYDWDESSNAVGRAYGVMGSTMKAPEVNYNASVSTIRLQEDARDRFFRNHPNKLAKKAGVNDERYVAINCQNDKTVELRFWRPSLKWSTTLAAIEATAASVEYSRQARFNPKLKDETLTFDSLVRWAATVGGYPCFVKRCVQRRLITAEEVSSLANGFATAEVADHGLVDA